MQTEETIMTIESSKNLGGVGALLMFIGIIPYISYFGIIEIIVPSATPRRSLSPRVERL